MNIGGAIIGEKEKKIDKCKKKRKKNRIKSEWLDCKHNGKLKKEKKKVFIHSIHGARLKVGKSVDGCNNKEVTRKIKKIIIKMV